MFKKYKLGNLICKFVVEGDESDTLYELRECVEDENLYVVWWDKSVLGEDKPNFIEYNKAEVESYFQEDNTWRVFGNKCKRAVLKHD